MKDAMAAALSLHEGLTCPEGQGALPLAVYSQHARRRCPSGVAAQAAVVWKTSFVVESRASKIASSRVVTTLRGMEVQTCVDVRQVHNTNLAAPASHMPVRAVFSRRRVKKSSFLYALSSSTKSGFRSKRSSERA